MTTFAWWRLNSQMIQYGKRVGGFVLLIVTLSATAAEPSWKDTFQVHGFASQAYILTSGNNFFGKSKDDGTFDFRELGVNASLRPLPDLLISGQLLSRWAGESDDGSVRLDYGLLDYSLVSQPHYQWGVRLGRIVNPLGLYNDTRDVAFTRPSILLPQSIYFDRARNLALSSDGGQLYGEYRTEWGDFLLQFGVAFPRAGEPDVERALLGGRFPGELKGNPSYGGRLLYERDGGRIRLGISGVQINIGYDPGEPIDPLQAGSIDFNPLILSAQYNAERWSVTGEYALRHFEYSNFGPRLPLPENRFTGESYYLQGTYWFTPKWEGVIRYDVLYTDRDDRYGSRFEAATGLPAHLRFAKDFTVGLRWDITPSLMLRAEYHNVNGTAWLPLEDNLDPFATRRHWDLFALLLSYRF